jgi:hypothetical protein
MNACTTPPNTVCTDEVRNQEVEKANVEPAGVEQHQTVACEARAKR